MASARSSCKDLSITRISTKSSVKELYRTVQGPVRKDFTRISTKSSQEDLCKIMQGHLGTYWGIAAGSSQDLLTRICTRSCKDLKKRTGRASKTIPSEKPKLRPTSCASPRSRNAHGHLTRALLCDNLQGTSGRPNGAPWSNPGPLAPTVRTPQCGHTLFGENLKYVWKWMHISCDSLMLPITIFPKV